MTEDLTSDYGPHVRGLIDFHLARNGALVGLEDTYPVGDDAVVRGLYEVAFIGVESAGEESGPAMIEEAARLVALALLVANYGAAFILPAVVESEYEEGEEKIVQAVRDAYRRATSDRAGVTEAFRQPPRSPGWEA